jgi:hypothetical protein
MWQNLVKGLIEREEREEREGERGRAREREGNREGAGQREGERERATERVRVRSRGRAREEEREGKEAVGRGKKRKQGKDQAPPTTISNSKHNSLSPGLGLVDERARRQLAPFFAVRVLTLGPDLLDEGRRLEGLGGDKGHGGGEVWKWRSKKERGGPTVCFE